MKKAFILFLGLVISSFLTSLAQVTAGVDNITNPGITSTVPVMTVYAPLTLTVSAAPLPIELSSFDAKRNNMHVNLSWSTSSETNNFGFNIEKSTDLKSWTKIGFVAGNGTSVSIKNYTFTDKVKKNIKNDQTIVYYRLNQITDGGGYCHSEAIPVSLQNANMLPPSLIASTESK